MCHAGMSREEIGNSSIPFIFAIMSTMGKRLCEKLGVPYNKKSDQQEEEPVEEEYPIPQASKAELQRRKAQSRKKESSSKKTYNASSKQDILDFFGGMASVEDS